MPRQRLKLLEFRRVHEISGVPVRNRRLAQDPGHETSRRTSFIGTCGCIRTPPGTRSPLFKKVYEEEFGQLGGQPYGCLIGDYSFSHLPTDVQLLRDLSRSPAPRTRRSSPLQTRP